MTEKNAKPRGKIKSHGHADLPVLPSKWCWATINDLAAAEPNSITDGPFGSNLKTSHYTETGPRVIRLQNIGDGIFHDATAHISESHFSRLKKHEVVAGDLVIAALGETLPRSCVMPPWVGPAIVKADCPRFRANRSIVLPEFVNYALNSPDTQRRTSEIIHGVGRPRLNLSEVRGIWIPLAPLNEQRRIVSKIEELFSDLDAGVLALKRAKANLKRYRAAVLKAAVEGKLTEEWRAKHPHAEPASKLLARILTERRQKWESEQLAKFAGAGKEPPKGWKDRYVEPTPTDTTELPELPDSWCWVNLGKMLYEIEGGKSFKCLTRRATDSEWGVIKVSAMTWGTFLEEEQKAIPPGSQIDASNEIKPGDLLLSRSNTTELVGASVLVGDCRSRLLLSDKSLRLKVSDLVDRRWLHKVISSSIGRRQLSAMATGTSDSMRNVSQEKIESVLLPLPPKDEQLEIVTQIEERISIIAMADVQVSSSLLRAARLRQSILKQAFEGKLVPQDPNDEPANESLTRLNDRQLSRKAIGDVAVTTKRGGRKSASTKKNNDEVGT